MINLTSFHFWYDVTAFDEFIQNGFLYVRYVRKQEVRNTRLELIWSLASWCMLSSRSNIWLITTELVWSVKQWMFLTKSFDSAQKRTLYQDKSCEIQSHFDLWSEKKEKYYNNAWGRKTLVLIILSLLRNCKFQ